MKSKIANILLFSVLLHACSNFEGAAIESTDRPIASLVIDNRNPQWLLDVNLPVKIEQFSIPKENTLMTGTFFTGYHSIGANLLLVDRHSSNASCIDKSGNILWALEPPSPGVDRYGNLGSVDLEYQAKEIYVEDRSKVKVDVFSFAGAYLRTITPALPFMEFAVLKPGELVYDVAEIDQQESIGGTPVGHRFLYQDGERLEFASPRQKETDPEAIPFNSYNRFSRVGNELYHRIPHEDLLYRIEGKKAEPVLRVSFRTNNQFNTVALDNSIKSKDGFLFDNEIPCPVEVVYNETDQKAQVIYSVGRRAYLIYQESGVQTINPSRYYNFGGTILPGPRNYDSGKFYLQLYKYQYDFLQQCIQDGTFNEEYMLPELRRLYGEIGDNDDILVFSLEFGKGPN